jgi:excisionase family DNA binding protein
MAETLEQTDLLTVPEAAQLLRLKPITLRDWICKKRIAYVKFSGRVFLRRTDIGALTSEHVVAPLALGKARNVRVNDVRL